MQTALALNCAFRPTQGARLQGCISGVTLPRMDGGRPATRSPLVAPLREINNCIFASSISDCTVPRSTTSIGQSALAIKHFTCGTTYSNSDFRNNDRWVSKINRVTGFCWSLFQLSQGKGAGTPWTSRHFILRPHRETNRPCFHIVTC